MRCQRLWDLSAGDPSIESRREVLMTSIIRDGAVGTIGWLFGYFLCFLYELPAVAVWRITGEWTQQSLPCQSQTHLIQQQSWISIWEDSAKPGIICWDNVVFIGNFFFSVKGKNPCRDVSVGNRWQGNNVNNVQSTVVHWEKWYHAHVCRIQINAHSKNICGVGRGKQKHLLSEFVY